MPRLYSYAPADSGWRLAIRDGLAVAVEPSFPVDGLWRVVGEGGSADDALDALSAGGIRSMPGFVLVDADPEGPGARLIARGAVRVTVGDDTLDTASATTWAEHRVASREGLRVEFSPGAAPAGAEEALLPLGVGVVLARVLSGADVPAAATGTEGPGVDGSRTAGTAAEGAGTAGVAAAGVAPSRASGRAAAGAARVSVAPSRSRAASTTPSAPAVPAPVEPPVVEPPEDATVLDAPDLDDDLESTILAADYDAATAVAAVDVVLPDGARHALAPAIVIGRAPAADDADPAGTTLLTLTTPRQAISRRHARIALRAGRVEVTDLGSRNGTRVTEPGGSPRRLDAHLPTAVPLGSRLDLGDGAVLTLAGGGSA